MPHRFRLLLASLSLIALATAGVEAHGSGRAQTSPGTLRGTYSLIHADGGRLDDSYTPVLWHDGKLITIHTLDAAPGSTVTLRHDALVSLSLAPHTAIGTRKLLIVPVVWGTKTIKGTQSSDKSFGTGPLTSWYKSASYGQFAWSANATPKVKITAPTGSDVGTWLNEIASRANTKIAALGYKQSNYSALLYETPTLIGGAAGYGMVPGRYAWVKTPLNIRVAAHELGHTLGLYHAHADECGSNQTPLGVAFAADSCASVSHECGSSTGTTNASCWEEYGDPFAAMGESWMQMSAKYPNAGSFDASEKAQLGWVTSSNGRSQAVTANGAYQLSPYEASTHTAPQALHIAAANGDYWFEYRTWTGIDSVFQTIMSYYGHQTFPSGVLVHLDHPVSSSSYDAGSLLLDTTATSSVFSQACQTIGLASLPGFCDAQLQDGQSFVDPGHFVVDVSHVASGNEQLQVTFDTTAPSAAGSPSPADGDSGVASQPAFTWTAAGDADSGVSYYAIYIDGALAATVAAADPLTYTPSLPLTPGQHSWAVYAIDRVNLSTASPVQTFTVS
jgi:hypothetical protein